MPSTPMRVLIRSFLYPDNEPKHEVHRKPHSHSSEGGPPDDIHVQGTKQVIVIREEMTIVYTWVTLELIPDPEMEDL